MRWTGIPVSASGGGGGGGGREEENSDILDSFLTLPLLAEELGRLPLTSKSYSLEVK